MIRIFVSIMTILLLSSLAHADIEWSGVYRFEGVLINDASLDEKGGTKEYGIHHLVLKPKIIIADGFQVNARLDVMNGASDQTIHPNNQIGQDWGGSNSKNDQIYSSMGSNAGAEWVEVSQLYMTYANNFGALILGRAPLDFGLGMTYSSGDGLFDHWYDSRDLVGFKIHFGNIYVYPMYGKVNEGQGLSNSISESKEIMVQVEYNNEELKRRVGFFFAQTESGRGEHDFPVLNAGQTLTDSLKRRGINFYYLQEYSRAKYGIELSYQNGRTGLVSGNSSVDLEGFGAAFEFDYYKENWSTDFSFKMGYASGDDKTTDDKVESFIFNRNYNLGMLLFNHGLGQIDTLGVQRQYTKGYTLGTGVDNPSRIEDYDVEAISNVFYFAPGMTYNFNDQWSLGGQIITGFLLEDPENITDGDSSLGYELNITTTFKPNDHVHFGLDLAGFLPGGAFENSDLNIDSGFTYGLMGKAAFSF